MSTGASAAERERRAAALQGLLAELELDALVLAGTDYRGHKGTLRWVADYNLVHRYGFAVAAPEREPWLVLPQNLAMGRRARLGDADALRARPAHGPAGVAGRARALERIGIVGLNQVDEGRGLPGAARRVPRRGVRRCPGRVRAGPGRARARRRSRARASRPGSPRRASTRLLELVRPGVDRAGARRGDVRALLRARRRGSAVPEHVSRARRTAARSTGGSASRATVCSDAATCSSSRSSWSAASATGWSSRAHGRARRAGRADQCG